MRGLHWSWTEVILVDLGTNPFERGQGSGTLHHDRALLREEFTAALPSTTHGKWSTIQPDGFGAGTLELRVEGRDGKLLHATLLRADHGRSLRATRLQSNVYCFLIAPDALERVIPAPRPQFRVTDSDNNAAIMGRVGDTFKIDYQPP